MVWGVRDQHNLISQQAPLPLPKHGALYLESISGALYLESINSVGALYFKSINTPELEQTKTLTPNSNLEGSGSFSGRKWP